MKQSDIIMDGHETLRKVAEEVKLPLSQEDKKTLIDMFSYVLKSQDDEYASKNNVRQGVGLAAPQINISKRMFVIIAHDSKKMHTMALINPKITFKSQEMTYLESGEGCLSVDDDVTDHVLRHNTIRVETHYLDLQTGEVKFKKMKLTGYISVVFQHEYDHLDGKLFIDKKAYQAQLNDVSPVKFD